MRKLQVFLLLLSILSSCKKDNSTGTPQPSPKPPSISSINPTSGNPGTEVTISGENFSPIINANTVKFNGIVATVVSATENSIVVKVPASAGDGPISVATGQGAASSPSFSYIPDIIIGGVEFNGSGIAVGKYWKNGTPIPVSDGTQDVFIRSMAVSGSDVYLAGDVHNIGGGNGIAKYWKNGVAISLTDGSHDAGVLNIVVVGSDVYVVGYESNGTNNVAKYWKNSVATSLTDGSANAKAWSCAVSGSDVYISGEDATGIFGTAAKYWKNGVATTLTTDTNNFARADHIVVSGSDIYITINIFNALTTTTLCKYWKNGVATDISNAYQINQLILVSNDVYLSGNLLGGTALYWKNGVANQLTDGKNYAYAHAITVYGNDIYVAGNEANGPVYVGKYWKNGVASNITNGQFSASIWGIVIR